MTNWQSSKMALNSVTIVSLSYFAWFCNKVDLLKSNTSSLRSFRILSTFSHFAWLYYAVPQISEIKLFQFTVHSCFTMLTKVPLSLVKRCWFCPVVCSSSAIVKTSWIMHYLIPSFCSSGRTFHRVYKNDQMKLVHIVLIKIQVLVEPSFSDGTYIHSFIENLQSQKFGMWTLWLFQYLVDNKPSVWMLLEFVQDVVCICHL